MSDGPKYRYLLHAWLEPVQLINWLNQNGEIETKAFHISITCKVKASELIMRQN